MGYTPRVLVVGGGATGTATARDLAMRGLEVTLVERGTLAGGATGRSGCLLEGGPRLARTDPGTAADCRAENRRLREFAGHCVEETGGVYAELSEDEADIEGLREACEEVGIPVEAVDGDEIGEVEPRLSPDVKRGLFVPDATVDPFRLTTATAASAREYGATIEPHTAVTDLLVEDGVVTGVEILQEGSAGTEERRTDYVVNAAGPRADRVAGMAGLDVPLTYTTGVMAVANDRPAEAVVRRCGSPDEGYVVPFGRRSVLGTTDVGADGPGGDPPESHDVDALIARASVLLPELGEARLLRGFRRVGTVPDPSDGSRTAPGGFEVFDHEERDGLWGVSTVAGGTLTTHRLAAEAVADQVCGKFGIDRPCTTAEYPLPGSDDGPAPETIASEFDMDTSVASRCVDRQGSRTRGVLSTAYPNPVVCACESVTRAEARDAVDGDDPDIEAVRVRTHAGMGECQSGRCCHRLGAQFHPTQEPSTVEEAVEEFHRRRWAGQRHALWGDQLQEAMRSYALHVATMNRDADRREFDLDAFEGGSRDVPDERGKVP